MSDPENPAEPFNHDGFWTVLEEARQEHAEGIEAWAAAFEEARRRRPPQPRTVR